jgi:transposase
MDTAAIDYRAQRGLAIVQGKGKQIRQVLEGKYLVPSQSKNSGSYFVDPVAGTCSCPDAEEHGAGHRCKHLYAVLIVRREITLPDGNVVTEEKRITYAQNWPAYRKARMNEKDIFEKLLRALCDGVQQPCYKGNGRPSLPLSDVIFAAGVKTFTLFSGDRAVSDIRSCQERGLTDVVPHPNTVFRIMREPETVPVLRRLIEESAKPLRTVEVDFAADGTGIATKGYVRWHDQKWGKDRREKKWLKLHMMIGVTTQIITGAEVTPGNAHDSPFLPGLIEQTGKNFAMREVSADMGYLSRENFKAIVKAGAEPFVPFKSNSKASANDDLWNRLFAFYTYNRPTFLEHYHKRSLTEATFSSVKRVLGSSVRAKSFEGQVSEIYMKVLCHNIRVLVQSIYELGIDASFWGEPPLMAAGGS